MDKVYNFVNGMKMQRKNGLTPNGNKVNGKWVLRDSEGVWVDFDSYRNDLIDKYSLKV
jgi:hypothetical protein